MADMLELTTKWTAAGSPGGLSVMYFDPELATPAEQRDALSAAWEAARPKFASSTTWSVANNGRIIDSVTGGLTGTWAEGSTTVTAGQGTGTPVSNSSMGLLRAATVIIHNGRRVKGRTFLPGLNTNILSSGQIIPGDAAVIASGFDNDFIASAFPVVWSRPSPALPVSEKYPEGRPARPGLAVPVASYSCWTELAVLRRRR
uniref:Uncharacterized protein n=1 Tax=uncultured prokaryote TaxID=198431 RepID=A0A0H5Q5Y2_9ZZZZ|nr:hypothetical protein [uncultured prokaryote]